MNNTKFAYPEELERFNIAEKILLEPAELSGTVINKVIGSVMGGDIDYADLYFQYSRSESWGMEEGIVKSGSFNIDQGVGFRALSKDKTAFAYSDDISLPVLKSAGETVKAIGDGHNVGSVPLEKSILGDRLSLYPAIDPLMTLADDKKVRLLKKVEEIARGIDQRVSLVNASLGGEYKVVLIARNDGELAADVRPLVRLSVQIIVEEKGRREQGSSGGGGRFGYEYFTDEIVTDYVQQAVDQAVVNLQARPAPAGTMAVVLGSGWPGVLLHEAIGHGLEGDFNRKGTSAFSGRVGERVASSGVTVVDDGTIEDRRGSLSVDDEGNKTQCTTLIEDGILRGYMQDSLNARLMKKAVTGNGRRESYAHTPMPRMTNTYMLNGDRDPNEILESVKNGLYAKNFGGGQVDIVSGKFVFSASEAYVIENGKIKQPVKGATLIGNGPDVLTRVKMIGNDMSLDPGVGTCGKDGQSVPVGVGQPTLRIDDLTVGGTHTV